MLRLYMLVNCRTELEIILSALIGTPVAFSVSFFLRKLSVELHQVCHMIVLAA